MNKIENNSDNEVYFLGSKPDAAKKKRNSQKWIWILISFAALLIGIVIFIDRNNKSDYYFEPEENTITVNNLPENPNSDTIKSYIERLEETINDVPLYIYIPHHAELSLGLNLHNKSQDSSNIICAMQAADIRRDNKNIVGDFILKGKQLSKGEAKAGFCAIINEKINIGVKTNTPLLQESIDSLGYFFRQYPLVNNGELVENNPKNKSIRRALAIRNGKVIMIESRSSESFHDFSQALIDIGVTEAIYLVGSANAYGWFINSENEKIFYGNKPNDRLKNISYIVWRTK